jgi:hypothetical protein
MLPLLLLKVTEIVEAEAVKKLLLQKKTTKTQA